MARGAEASQQRVERREELQALARLMSDGAGRRWMRNFLLSCHVWDSNGQTNPIAAAYWEGERSTGLRLQRDIAAANLEAFLLLQKEHHENERPSERGERDDSDDDDLR